jgi:hypothetical protein
MPGRDSSERFSFFVAPKLGALYLHTDYSAREKKYNGEYEVQMVLHLTKWRGRPRETGHERGKPPAGLSLARFLNFILAKYPARAQQPPEIVT